MRSRNHAGLLRSLAKVVESDLVVERRAVDPEDRRRAADVPIRVFQDLRDELRFRATSGDVLLNVSAFIELNSASARDSMATASETRAAIRAQMKSTSRLSLIHI